MEVSARKLPLIPPTRLCPSYSKDSLVSVTANNVYPRPRLFFFSEEISRLPPGCYAQFLPRFRGHDSAMADFVSAFTQRSVEVATTKKLPSEWL